MRNSNDDARVEYPKSRALLKRGIILGIAESFLVGLSFYLGFILIDFSGSRIPYVLSAELALMSLGAAFSYAFVLVFRRNYRGGPAPFSKRLATDLFWNISYAYLVHLSILFLVKDSGFSEIRSAIGVGYALGYMAILMSRLLISPVLSLTPAREGKKTIIFKGMAIPATPVLSRAKGNQISRQRELGYGRMPISDRPRLEKVTVGSEDLTAKY